MSGNTISCKNCGNHFRGKFCNQCGEKVYTAHDKSILHFFEDAFHFITHFEGTFFNTLKAVFSKPGKLSLDYCDGLRKKYFKPLPFFMLLVVLYLIFPFFTGLNMPFKYYLNKGSYASKITTEKSGVAIDSALALIDIAQRQQNFKSRQDAFNYIIAAEDSLIRKSEKLSAIESTFNKKSEKISKLLLLILLPLTGFALWLFSIRKRQFFFDHLVLATELNSFYLLFSFFLLPLALTVAYKLFPMAVPKNLTDTSIGIFSYTIVAIFAARAFRLFYNDRWWWAVVKSLLVVLAHYFIVQIIYKFILFAITFHFST